MSHHTQGDTSCGNDQPCPPDLHLSAPYSQPSPCGHLLDKREEQ